jgi:hypothetical protein
MDHEPRNKFGHLNILKFKMDCELKFREQKIVLNFVDLIKITIDFVKS